MTHLNNSQFNQAVELAASTLASGQLVAIPTETVYGLAADAEQDEAVAKIFLAKGRPSDHPLIVHVLGQEQAHFFASDLPVFAKKLMDAFWPGPLTIIVPRQASVAQAAAGGQTSIGLRSPSHPVARQLLEKCLTLGVRGLAAPSANLFGRVSPTTAAHVRADFDDDLLVLDGGECSVGIESTIVDCTRQQPVLLRPGMISSEQIQSVLEENLQLNSTVAIQGKEAPKASGTLESHYAPLAKVRLFSRIDLENNIDAYALLNKKVPIGIYSTLPKRSIESIIWREMPKDVASCAHELFSVLRDFDNDSVTEIWVEKMPDLPSWAGVNDRIKRAAASV